MPHPHSAGCAARGAAARPGQRGTERSRGTRAHMKRTPVSASLYRSHDPRKNRTPPPPRQPPGPGAAPGPVRLRYVTSCTVYTIRYTHTHTRGRGRRRPAARRGAWGRAAERERESHNPTLYALTAKAQGCKTANAQAMRLERSK